MKYYFNKTCFHHFRPASMIAVLGAHNVFIQTEPTQQRIFVPSANFKIHTDWNANLIRNDLAVARLPEVANYGQTIHSVRLPNWRQIDITFAGQEAIVSGWGRFSDSSNGNCFVYLYCSLQKTIFDNFLLHTL